MLISQNGELVVGFGLLILEISQFVEEEEEDDPENNGDFIH